MATETLSISTHPASAFTLLGIKGLSVGVLNRHLFAQLWDNVLGTSPIVNPIHLSDDDELSLGISPCNTTLTFDPLSEPSGYIELWVDNLTKAYELLQSRVIPVTKRKLGLPPPIDILEIKIGKVIIHLYEAGLERATAYRNAARTNKP